MNNEKGYIGFVEVLIIVIIIFLLTFVPISLDQTTKRKQKIMKQVGIEMSYWDTFWTNPDIQINQGQIKVEKK